MLPDSSTHTDQARALLAAGVRADALWRAHYMANPELLDRKGIEVVPVGADAMDADVRSAAAAA